MFWARIDNRLVHGQVIESWIPFTGAKILVVANDELANDILQQEIMSLAIPQDVEPHFVAVEDLSRFVSERKSDLDDLDILVLFASCQDAKRAFDRGLAFHRLNVGNLHYGPGKKQLCAHVAVSAEDESCLHFFSLRGVALDFRCIPTVPIQVRPTW